MEEGKKGGGLGQKDTFGLQSREPKIHKYTVVSMLSTIKPTKSHILKLHSIVYLPTSEKKRLLIHFF